MHALHMTTANRNKVAQAHLLHGKKRHVSAGDSGSTPAWTRASRSLWCGPKARLGRNWLRSWPSGAAQAQRWPRPHLKVLVDAKVRVKMQVRASKWSTRPMRSGTCSPTRRAATTLWSRTQRFVQPVWVCHLVTSKYRLIVNSKPQGHGAP